MKRLDIHSTAFTLLLGMLVTLASFATDMGLPVLAQTAASLHVTPATAALTMSVFMAGFALGPLVCGPLSDHFGRRPVLLAGVATFAVCGAAGAFAQTFATLLMARVLMGVGAGTSQVLVLAMVRDLFTGHEARVRQSYVNMAGGIAPIVAPSLGVWIAASLGGWRAIYGALGAGGVVLFAVALLRLRESAPRVASRVLSVGRTLRDYGRVVRHPVSFGYAVVMALCFGCLFAYVSGSSLVLIGLLGVTRRAYGFLFAATALGLMAGSLLSARLSRRGVAHTRLVSVGLAAVVATALVALVLAMTGALQAWSLVGLIVVSHMGQGMLRPSVAQGALEPMPEVVGVASAVLSATQMLTGALASGIAAALFDGRTALAMTGTMSVCALGAAGVYFGFVRRAERRTVVTHLPEMAEAEFTVAA